MQDEVADTGLMLMGHRFYDPSLGRFLNRDPIGFAGSINLYEYASNSPSTRIDPTGLTSLFDLLDPQSAIDWYNSKADSYISDSYLSALHPGALFFRTLGVGVGITPPAAAQDFAIAWGDQNTSGLWRAWTTLGFVTSLTPFGIGARASTTTAGNVGSGMLRSQRCGGFAQFGKNSWKKLRNHWGDIRNLAKRQGFDLPSKFKNSHAEIEEFIDRIVDLGETRVGPYKPTGGGDPAALWTNLDDAVVIRRSDGEFLTILDASGGGQTKNFPGGL